MDFITIDFETANSSRDSVCAIGLAKYKNGLLVDTLETLIDPEDYFDGYNTYIHGITKDMVIDAPTFLEFYPILQDFIENEMLIAHFAAFDMSVLRHACEKYNLPYPTFTYSCTYQLSKKIIPGEINYKLKTLANKYNFEFQHHDALEDAKACGYVLLSLFKEADTKSFETLLKLANLNIGKHSPNSYRSSSTKNVYRPGAEITTTKTNFDEEHPFYNQLLVFTGTLQSMVRNEAAQRVVDLGANFGNNVTKSTTFLIIGDQDLQKFGEGFKSSKMKKAESLKNQGKDIEIVGEQEFLKML
ncbi:exonuclease domain-containing protein [Sporosarcina sp. CAU 1771]